jgi:DNA-binding NarL/FixJ family response regulator
MRPLNIVLADDQPIFVEGLLSVLSKPGAKFEYSIKGVARNGTQMSDLLRSSAADVVLMDWNLPDMDGLRFLPVLKKGGGIRVLVMSAFDDPRMVQAALRAGADGFMLKNGSGDELVEAIEAIADGRTFVGHGLSAHLYNNSGVNGNGAEPNAGPDKRFARRYGLTKRELELMQYIGQAMNNKEIASKLYISDQTVSVHRKNIMRKLGVNNTASLIKIAFENNLV